MRAGAIDLRPCWNAACDERAHGNERAFSDRDRLVGGSVANDSASADVDAIADVNIAVAGNFRGEGHKVANDAIVGDIAVNVALELLADASGGGDYGLVAEHRAGADFYIITDYRRRGEQASVVQARMPSLNPLTGTAVADRDHNFVIRGDVLWRDNRDAENRHARLIGGEDDALSTGALGHGCDLATEAACSVNHKSPHPQNMLESERKVKAKVL